MNPNRRNWRQHFAVRREFLETSSDHRIKRIRAAIQGLSREELLLLLDQTLYEMDEGLIATIFDDLVAELAIAPLAPADVLAGVKQFHAHSLAGKYYAPFDINSQNYNWVPPETDAWFSELSTWLDRSCELIEEGYQPFAKQCLDLLLELIRKMNNGNDIIFAHDYGDWMISTKHDYQARYTDLS